MVSGGDGVLYLLFAACGLLTNRNVSILSHSISFYIRERLCC